jgi:hypothetical protein
LIVDRRFPYETDLRFAPVSLGLRLVPGRQGVTLTGDGRFVARFGVLRLETPLSNIAGAHVTGPYRWWTAVGARLSLADDGLTFGTTSRGGVCVHFREPVKPVLGPRAHSALTVTVADREGLVAALGSA